MPLLTFNVFLHVGTIIAIFYFLRQDIIDLLKNFFSDLKEKNYKGKGISLAFGIIIATIPLVSVYFYKDLVKEVTGTLKSVGYLFFINGVILIIGNIISLKLKKSQKSLKDVQSMSKIDALLIGLSQLLAVFPGISRSGTTISAALIRKLDGEAAVKFSFLISIPALLGATLLEAKEVFEVSHNMQIDWLMIGLGVFFSFIFGLLSLRALIWLGKKILFYPFGIYTIILSFIIGYILW